MEIAGVEENCALWFELEEDASELARDGGGLWYVGEEGDANVSKGFRKTWRSGDC